MSEQTNHSILAVKLDNLAAQMEENARSSSKDREEMKSSIQKLSDSLHGTPGVPGIGMRVDRIEQAYLRSQKIQNWILGVVGSIIAAQGITIINLIVTKMNTHP